jgi:hypothetical protein
MSHGAIYLETNPPDVSILGEGVTFTSDKSGARYEFMVAGQPVTLNVLPEGQLAQHLLGFSNYVQLFKKDPEENRRDAVDRISRIRCVLGMITDHEFDEILFEPLSKLIWINGGLVFSHNSIYLGDGSVLVGSERE